jgi:hypothetical protein
MKSGIHPQNTFLTVRMTDGSIYVTSMLLLPGERNVFATLSSSSDVSTLQFAQRAAQRAHNNSFAEKIKSPSEQTNNETAIFGFQRLPLKLAQDPKTHNTWTS